MQKKYVKACDACHTYFKTTDKNAENMCRLCKKGRMSDTDKCRFCCTSRTRKALILYINRAFMCDDCLLAIKEYNKSQNDKHIARMIEMPCKKCGVTFKTSPKSKTQMCQPCRNKIIAIEAATVRMMVDKAMGAKTICPLCHHCLKDEGELLANDKGCIHCRKRRFT